MIFTDDNMGSVYCEMCLGDQTTAIFFKPPRGHIKSVSLCKPCIKRLAAMCVNAVGSGDFLLSDDKLNVSSRFNTTYH
jgi:hypothetical protein